MKLNYRIYKEIKIEKENGLYVLRTLNSEWLGVALTLKEAKRFVD